MRFNIRTACIVAAILVGSAPVAFAQGGGGGSTDRNYNATGSQGVGSKGGMTAAPSEHATSGSTAGMSTKHRSKTGSTRAETSHHTTGKAMGAGQHY